MQRLRSLQTFALLTAISIGLAILGTRPSCSLAANTPRPLTPVEARQKVGEEITVEMMVQAAKDRLEKRGEIYLDAEPDFRSERNFAVVINREGAASFQANGVKDFEEYFRGKTIRAKGVVTVVDDVPRIEVSDSKQIEIVK